MIKSIVQEATKESLYNIMDLIEKELSCVNCQNADKTKICLAFEEIFVNIVNYAYPNTKEGMVTVKYGINEGTGVFHMIFIDDGVPYNPLVKRDPDVTLSAEKRNIGGLGIFLCKNFLDKMEYVYENNQNVLITEKKILNI